jgi:hypothetical protein
VVIAPMVLLQSSSKPSLARLKNPFQRIVFRSYSRAYGVFMFGNSNGTVFIASDARSMMILDVY